MSKVAPWDATRPRSLRDPEAVAERRALWQGRPTLAALRDYAGDLSIRGRDTPAFDPTDAGLDARVMFVLEAPGPKAAAKGSAFISADNNDQTAAGLWQARTDAGLVDGCILLRLRPPPPPDERLVKLECRRGAGGAGL